MEFVASALTPEQRRMVHDQLTLIASSEVFVHSPRALEFLKRIVRHAVAGETDQLSERMLGAEMFGRPVAYDTGSDSVVRVKASEVRKKLEQYNLQHHGFAPVLIELPRGSYVPVFSFPEPPAAWEATPPLGNTVQGAPPVESAQPATLPAKSGAKRWIFLSLAMVGAVLLASIPIWRPLLAGRSTIQSIAVLPFVNLSGDPEQDYLADGITDELIANLGQLSSLRVISRTSTMSMKGSNKTLPEISKQLGADGILEGTMQRDGSQVRITIKLFDAPHDRLLWANSYTLDRSNIRALQAELAVTIASRVNAGPASSGTLRKEKLPQANADAEEIYLQGLQQQNGGGFTKAIELYQRALGLDPAAAQAHAGLAYCYGRLGETGQIGYADAFSHQKEEAIKAIGLDSSVPEGHIELANAAMNLDWDWATAAREFSQALRLNPSSALAHERYAIYLERTGNFNGAIDEVNKSMLLDPVSARSFDEAMFTYYFARRYDDALELHRRAYAGGILKAPDSFLLGNVYAEMRQYAKSIAAYRGDGTVEPGVHVLGHLGYAYARSGNRSAALDAVAKIRKQLNQTGIGRYEIAIVNAGLGHKDQAIFWLEEALKAHDEGLTNLRQDPCFDSLRSDARFSGILRRLGLR